MDSRLRSSAFSILLLLVACAPSYGDLNSGLLSGKPCAAPCWNNLTPGKSTEADVGHFTYQVADDFPIRSSTQATPSCKQVQIRDKAGPVVGAAVTFSIEDGVLTFIESSPRYPISLQELVGHLGPPEYYEAILAVGPDGSDYQVEVYYPGQGLAFRVVASDVGFIRAYMEVLSIQYFAAGSLLSYFTIRRSCYMSQADAVAEAQREIATYIQPWTGFGKVQIVETGH